MSKISNLKIFFVGVGFLSIMILFSLAFKFYDSKNGIKYFMQKKIDEKLVEVNLLLPQLEKSYLNNTKQLLYNDYPKMYENEGFIMAVLKGDSLVYWNTQFFLFKADELIAKEHKPFIKYKNGYYLNKYISNGDYKYFILILLKYEHNYQNSFLNNDFHNSFSDAKNVIIVDYKTNDYITDLEGNFLFSIIKDGDLSFTLMQSVLLLSLYIIAIVLIVFGLWTFALKFYEEKYSKYLLLLVIFLFVVIIEILFNITKISPSYYSDFLSTRVYFFPIFGITFGDFVLNSVLLFTFSYFLYKIGSLNDNPINVSCRYNLLVFIGFYVLLFGGYIFILFLISDFFKYSNISFDITDFQNIDYLAFVGIYSIMMLFGAYFYLLITFGKYCFRINGCVISKKVPLFYFVFLIIPTIFFYKNQGFVVYAIFLTILFFYLYIIRVRRIKMDNIYLMLMCLVFFAGLTTYILNVNQINKEKEYRRTLVRNLAFGKINTLAEFYFNKERDSMNKDGVLMALMSKYYLSSTDDGSEINKYIFRKYFKGYWDKYIINVTVCFENDSLLIDNDHCVGCLDYFDNLINEFGVKQNSKDFYLLEFSPNENAYLGVFKQYYQDLDINGFLIVEISPKTISRFKGYQDLTVNKSVFASGELSQYSFARYFFNELAYKVGEYEYPYYFKIPFDLDSAAPVFVDHQKYNHLLFRIDKDEVLILSREHPSITTILAPFSYIFICYVVGAIFIYMFSKFLINRKILRFRGYSVNIQLWMILILFFSFLSISIFSVQALIRIDEKKNIANLTEKSYSVQNELELVMGLNENVTLNKNNQALDNLLLDLSNLFLVDINLYDTTGRFISSSKNQIFEEDIISENMDPAAFNKMRNEHSTYYIHKEKIGNYEYISSYIPFIEENSGVVAYINLPYFSRQKEEKRSLYNFIITTVNIYVILIMISIVVVYLISRITTRPLRLLSEKLMNFNLFKNNEKMEWNANDEIGFLVREYNRVVDELAVSAEKLAASERESAWKEMARQIAHEVKNPLTPMKLSIQHLQRAWKKGDMDFDARLERFTNTMIEQIDTLASISTTFSDYAKLSVANKERVDIIEILNNVVSFFKDSDVGFSYSFFECKRYIVSVDKNQMTQVFNNLINNAIQSIDSDKQGLINFEVIENGGYILISVSDNGCGMDEETKNKIFNPYFTTKSSGTGLGLSIVRNIIYSFNGEITFESEKNVGTTFYIKLRLINESL